MPRARKTVCSSAKALKRIPVRELRARRNGAALLRLRKKAAAKWTAKECELAARAVAPGGLGDGSAAGACPTYTISCKARPNKDGPGEVAACVATNTETKRPLGEIKLRPDAGDRLRVSFVEVRPRYRRCGVATRLYEAALAEACRQNRRLSSDGWRTAASEEFWQKQVRRGRASCAGGEPAVRLNAKFEPTEDRWPCGTFVMNETCADEMSLNGLGGLGAGEACPTYTITCRRVNIPGQGVSSTCTASPEGSRRILGEIVLNPVGPDLLATSMVAVTDEFRRCGIATRLYEAALAEACSQNRRLSSDTMRTEGSEGFWQKQVARGRASCVSDAPGERLDARWRADGAWPCERFAMNETCSATVDLRGLGRATQTARDLRAFLEVAAPDLLQRHIFRCYTLKACSAIAPAFTHLARRAGFEVRTVHNGYHYYSLVDTADGVYEVDLSAMQFVAPPEGEEAYYDFVDELIAKTKEDPLAAVTLRKTEQALPDRDAYGINADASMREEAAFDQYRQRRGLGALQFDGERLWTDETRSTPWKPDYRATERNDARLEAMVQHFRRAQAANNAASASEARYALSTMAENFGVAIDPQVGAPYAWPPEPPPVLKPALFHAAPAYVMPSIMREGLRPRQGAGLFQHGGYDLHSQGKLFLADNFYAAERWKGKVTDQLEHHFEDPRKHKAVILRTKNRRTKRDPVGDKDVAGSRFITVGIPPEKLEFFDARSQRWRPIAEYDERRAGDPPDEVSAHKGLKGVPRFAWGAAAVDGSGHRS